jgi:hypothetical protein
MNWITHSCISCLKELPQSREGCSLVKYNAPTITQEGEDKIAVDLSLFKCQTCNIVDCAIGWAIFIVLILVLFMWLKWNISILVLVSTWVLLLSGYVLSSNFAMGIAHLSGSWGGGDPEDKKFLAKRTHRAYHIGMVLLIIGTVLSVLSARY